MAQQKIYRNGQWETHSNIHAQRNGEMQEAVGKVYINGEWVPFTQDDALPRLGDRIDDFEHNDLDGYWTIQPTSGNIAIRQEAAKSGNYGLWSEGHNNVWSLPWKHDLPNYPAPGRKFVTNFYPHHWEDIYYDDNDEEESQFWVLFGGNSDDQDNWYSVEVIHTGTFRLRYRRNGSTYLQDGNRFETGFNLFTKQWYSIRVDWYDKSKDGRTGFKCWLYDSAYEDVDDPKNDYLARLNTYDDTYTSESRFGLWFGGGDTFYVDDIYMLE